jgi:hypothetical protein
MAAIARKVVVAFREKPVATHSPVIDQLSHGKTILEDFPRINYKEIANVLFISPETVRKHVLPCL